jgi:acyl carrier protein
MVCIGFRISDEWCRARDGPFLDLQIQRTRSYGLGTEIAVRVYTGADGLQQDMLEMVYAAIDEVNAQANGEAVLAKVPDARLLGGEQGVDSLTFVNLIVALEEQIQNRLGKSVVLVNEDSMALQEHPFRTVGTLAKYAGEMVASLN